MENNNQNNWKSYVDWWPTYIVIGISLTYLVHQTGIVQKLTNKLFNQKDKQKSNDSEEY